MMLLCAISGQTPEVPVVSSKSGHVFEKELVKKIIETTGRCPITDKPLALEDLIEVKGINKSVKPRPTTATSIPGMLQLFHNEWDAVMLESFTLKKQLEAVRQELAHSLYQHDAACRVIARLIKERDEARKALALASMQQGVPENPRIDSMDVDQKAGLTEAIIEKMKKKSDELSKERKSRKTFPNLASADTVRSFEQLSSHSMHKSSHPGILCVDLHPKNTEMVLTGGVDGNVLLFNRQSEKIMATLAGHAKKVSQVKFHPSESLIFSSSHDKTAIIWAMQAGSWQKAHQILVHTGEVTDISLQPTGDFLATASTDKSWAMHDVHTGACLIRVQKPDLPAIHCASFHPDGLIVGTGTADSLVRIWDVKTQDNVATFDGHKGSFADICFSENGYYLATATAEEFKIWDLRKPKCLMTVPADQGGAISALRFDSSGRFLAVAASDIRIFNGKATFKHMKTINEHDGLVTDVAFGPDAMYLGSTSMDRTLKFFGKSQ